MRIKISLIVVILSLLFFLSSSAQIKNSIVAKVGNEIITTYEIENEYEEARANFGIDKIQFLETERT